VHLYVTSKLSIKMLKSGGSMYH